MDLSRRSLFATPALLSGCSAAGAATNDLRRALNALELVPSELHEPIMAEGPTPALTNYLQAGLDKVGERGGVLVLPGGLWRSDPLTIRPKTEIVGIGQANTALARASASERPFISSDGAWVGMRGLRIDCTGSAANGVVLVGRALQLEDLIIHGAAGWGLLTQGDTALGSKGWLGQEESYVHNLAIRENGGGWLNRGPHNLRGGFVECCYNSSWGYRSERSLSFDGNVTAFGQLHTYANGGDRGVYVGAVSTFANLVTDGDNLVIDAPDCQIDRLKTVFGGGEMDAVTVHGDRCTITRASIDLWSKSKERWALVLNGSDADVTARLGGAAANFGARVEGARSDLIVNVAGLALGVHAAGANNRISGRVTGCAEPLRHAGASNDLSRLVVS